jgi:hypothetical protein
MKVPFMAMSRKAALGSVQVNNLFEKKDVGDLSMPQHLSTP